MKLLLVFAAILAFSLAEEEKKKEIVEDSEAEASAPVQLLRQGSDLTASASSYNTYVPPSQRPPQWSVQPVVPPQNTWLPPKPETVKPIQPIYTGSPVGVQNDYYNNNHQQQYWTTPTYHHTTTASPVAVIKDDRYYGENGHYKYEYKLNDGTHVGEEGYFTDAKQTDESLVKKGWYSYVGADGKTYTVTYWADKTGYHAYGDHLPTPPPVPAAIQAALDKEKEAEKYKPQYDYPTQTPAPVYPTQGPTYAPPVYVPSQNPTYPPLQDPVYPIHQQPVQQHQQTYYPPQPTYYPPQQNYNPHPHHY